MLIDKAILASDYIGTTDTAQDEQLDRICARAQSILDGWMHYRLGAQQYADEKHDGCGDDYFYLISRPIITVSSLTIDDESIDLDDIFLYEDQAKVDVNFPIPNGKQNIVITYWAGYVGDVVPAEIVDLTTPALPKVIEEAMYMIAHRLWLNSGLSGQPRQGLSSRSGDGGTTNFLQNLLPADMISALEQYRRLRL